MAIREPAAESEPEVIEPELIVLIPPSRQYVVDAQIIDRRRPDLLIAPEDFGRFQPDLPAPDEEK